MKNINDEIVETYNYKLNDGNSNVRCLIIRKNTQPIENNPDKYCRGLVGFVRGKR